ncbi:efflux transporter outer membrane subunit [Desulfosarcina sp. OttesenSCG-928-G17]|nr:efflux transporter outer membrane subunit [Desulfosarcina sp. OttesenSCG-928-G17]
MKHKIWIFIGSLMVFLVVGSCSFIPSYNQPDTTVPETWPDGPAYRDVADGSPDAPSPVELPWREFYTDPRMQVVIETALAYNTDLQLAALNVVRARGLYGIQRAELFPALDATGTGGKRRVPSDLSPSGESYRPEEYDVDLGVFSWEIDFFGRLRSLKEQALQSYLATTQAFRSVRIMLISTVAQAYLTLAADQENLHLAQTTYENQRSMYLLIKRRHDMGLASNLDLNRARTQMEAARVDMARYTRMVAQDQNALSLLTGVFTSLDLEDLPPDLSGIMAPADIRAGLSSDVLLNRPDILQAENMLRAANANIGAARSALFPRISLTATVGTASAELHNLFSSGQDTWSIAPSILLPVFDARLWAALDVSKADQKIAVVQYQQTIQTAFREVADALAMQGTVDQQLAAQAALVRASAETFRLANMRYARGLDSYLEVLDAQRALYAAQQALVSLNLSKLANHVHLYAALGGGVD